MLYFPKTQFLSFSHASNCNTDLTHFPSTPSLLSPSLLGSLLKCSSCGSTVPLSRAFFGSPGACWVLGFWLSTGRWSHHTHIQSGNMSGGWRWRGPQGRLPHSQSSGLGLRPRGTGSCGAQITTGCIGGRLCAGE